MKVEKPRFDEADRVYCDDCPWDNLDCPVDGCPTAANYEEECAKAEPCN